MQMRRHSDIIAIKYGNRAPVALHARNLEVASISEESWNSMAPTSFDNSFEMKMLVHEDGVDEEAFKALEQWQSEDIAGSVIKKIAPKVKSLTINVTQLCNLHCVYCAAGGDGTYGEPVAKISIAKTLPQVEFFIGKLAVGEQFQITFLGGEPLLYPEAIQAIGNHAKEVAKKVGAKVSFKVITNATLISDKVLDVLADLNLNFIVSIDGPPESHDRVRPQKNGQGSAAAALEGLRLLLNRKEQFGKILIHAVFSKNNLDVEEAYRFFRSLPVDAFEFTFDITESDRDSNIRFMSEMVKVAELAFSIGGESELRKISLFDSYFYAIDNQIKTENHCGAGKSLLSIDSKNRIYTCPLDAGGKQNVVGENQLINDTMLVPLQDSLIEKNNCQSCWARFLCGGGCMFAHKSLTGDKHKKHNSYCERTRYLIALTLLYYEQSRD